MAPSLSGHALSHRREQSPCDWCHVVVVVAQRMGLTGCLLSSSAMWYHICTCSMHGCWWLYALYSSACHSHPHVCEPGDLSLMWVYPLSWGEHFVQSTTAASRKHWRMAYPNVVLDSSSGVRLQPLLLPAVWLRLKQKLPSQLSAAACCDMPCHHQAISPELAH